MNTSLLIVSLICLMALAACRGPASVGVDQSSLQPISYQEPVTPATPAAETRRSRPAADYGNANSRNPRVFAKVARKSSLAVETRRNFSLPDRFHHHAVRDHHPIFDRARQKARQA